MALEYCRHGLLPDANHVVPHGESRLWIQVTELQNAAELWAISGRTGQDDHAPRRQAVTVVEEGVIQQDPVRQPLVAAGLDLHVGQPRLGAADSDDLVHGGDGGGDLGINDGNGCADRQPG